MELFLDKGKHFSTSLLHAVEEVLAHSQTADHQHRVQAAVQSCICKGDGGFIAA